MVLAYKFTVRSVTAKMPQTPYHSPSVTSCEDGKVSKLSRTSIPYLYDGDTSLTDLMRLTSTVRGNTGQEQALNIC